jgi:hypothetical protein
VRLDAEPPLRMGKAILDGQTLMILEALVFEWLQKEMLERLRFVSLRINSGLWNDELDLVSA